MVTSHACPVRNSRSRVFLSVERGAFSSVDRWLIHLVGALNILGLMIANMIGFATAAGGTARMCAALGSWQGAGLLRCATIMLYHYSVFQPVV
jgi:hypothetical protein